MIDKARIPGLAIVVPEAFAAAPAVTDFAGTDQFPIRRTSDGLLETVSYRAPS